MGAKTTTESLGSRAEAELSGSCRRRLQGAGPSGHTPTLAPPPQLSGHTMAGGRPQLKRSFSIIPCFVFVEVRNPNLSQTLPESQWGGVRVPPASPHHGTLGTSHTPPSLSFLIGQRGVVRLPLSQDCCEGNMYQFMEEV